MHYVRLCFSLLVVPVFLAQYAQAQFGDPYELDQTTDWSPSTTYSDSDQLLQAFAKIDYNNNTPSKKSVWLQIEIIDLDDDEEVCGAMDDRQEVWPGDELILLATNAYSVESARIGHRFRARITWGFGKTPNFDDAQGVETMTWDFDS